MKNKWLRYLGILLCGCILGVIAVTVSHKFPSSPSASGGSAPSPQGPARPAAPRPTVVPGQSQGIKITYIDKLPTKTEKDLPAGKPVHLESYYFHDGSFWIEVPYAFVIHTGDTNQSFYFRKSFDPRLFSIVDNHASNEIKNFHELKNEKESCTVNGKPMGCVRWVENFIPPQGFPIRRESLELPFAAIFGEKLEFQRVKNNLAAFFGKESFQSSSIPFSVSMYRFNGKGEDLVAQFSIESVEAFDNLAPPGLSLEPPQPEATCRFLQTYECK